MIGCSFWQILTAVVLVAAVGAVTEAVAAEATDDAVDAISAAKKQGGALRLHLCYKKKKREMEK